MVYSYRKWFFFNSLILLIFFTVSGQEQHPVIPDLYNIDSQVSGQGFYSARGNFAHFSTNPSFALLPSNRRFPTTIHYQYDNSFSAGISDSFTTPYSGGIHYSNIDDLSTIRFNTGFQLVRNFIFIGVNLKHLDGTHILRGKSINGYSVDLGASAVLFKRLYIGISTSDLINIYGDYIPMILHSTVDFELYEKHLFLNAGFTYHLQHKKESYTEHRSFLPHSDMSLGASFVVNWFFCTVGVLSPSNKQSFNFDTLIKSASLGVYKFGKGGISTAVNFTETFHSFSITLTWDIFPSKLSNGKKR